MNIQKVGQESKDKQDRSVSVVFIAVLYLSVTMISSWMSIIHNQFEAEMCVTNNR